MGVRVPPPALIQCNPVEAIGQLSNQLAFFIEIKMSAYFVYGLASVHRSYIYVGLSNDLDRRLSEHNRGYNKTTRAYAPFILIYSESCEDRVRARQREKYWKGGSGKRQLHKLWLVHASNPRNSSEQ
jgi:putative endonuclease